MKAVDLHQDGLEPLFVVALVTVVAVTAQFVANTSSQAARAIDENLFRRHRVSVKRRRNIYLKNILLRADENNDLINAVGFPVAAVNINFKLKFRAVYSVESDGGSRIASL